MPLNQDTYLSRLYVHLNRFLSFYVQLNIFFTIYVYLNVSFTLNVHLNISLSEYFYLNMSLTLYVEAFNNVLRACQIHVCKKSWWMQLFVQVTWIRCLVDFWKAH